MSRIFEFRSRFSNPLAKYAAATLICVWAVLLRYYLNGVLGEQSRYAFLLPSIFFCAVYLGFEQGLLVMLLGPFLTVLIVIPPVNSFDMSRSEVSGLVVFMAISSGVLWLTHREVNERRRRMEIEQKLEQANLALERKVLERTAELKTVNDELEGFCHSMAHDLRTPTRALAGNARILLEDHSQKLPHELAVHLERINSAAIKLGSLVDALLIYARLGKQELQISDVNVSAITTEIAQAEARRAKIELDLKVPRSLFVQADERQFRILIRSLVDNSIVYRKPGEPVHIELARSTNEIVFADRGIGFDMAYAHKVFLPFERLHRDDAYPGVGMGLANVERVVKRHGGEISVKTSPGEGTEIHMNLVGAIAPEKPLMAAMTNVR